MRERDSHRRVCDMKYGEPSQRACVSKGRGRPVGSRSSHGPSRHYIVALEGNGDGLARWEKSLALRQRAEQPAVRLWAEVLVEAIRTLLKTPFESRFREALDWIVARDPSYSIGSFDGTCLVLGLDEEYVRRDLLRRAKDSRYAKAMRAKACMNHKRRRPKHQCAGCLMCKPHKDRRAGKKARWTLQEQRHRGEATGWY